MQDTYRGNKLHTCLAFAIAHVKLLDDHTKPPAKERYNDLFRIKNEYNCLMSVVTKEAAETRANFNKKGYQSREAVEFSSHHRHQAILFILDSEKIIVSLLRWWLL